MAQVTFDPPEGPLESPPDTVALKQRIAEADESFWLAGRGSGVLTREQDDGSTVELMVLPNLEVPGFYLKHSVGSDTHLSQHDPSKMTETVECEEEWFASVGLFLPPEAAAEAVEHFINTGGMSPDVTWITPDDVPEDGNY